MDKLNISSTPSSVKNGRGERLLVINPGSTSTKIAVYENETPLLVRNIRHTVEELSAFPRVIDQFEFRKSLVLRELEVNDIPFRFDAVIGRGGLVKPIPGGVYEVNEAMKRDTLHAMRTHACNLGGLIADELAAALPGCRAFIADPGVVDELEEVARITGSPLMPRITIWHALNQKAIKNPTEISNMKKAHLLDGIAMTKFIYWLKTNVGKEKITELSLGEKLEEFRTVAKSYIEPSFTPIVGYNDHGAIVHYSANKESDYEIKDEGMVLIDSGGHYLEGTTDITRTISLGKVMPKMKKMYTAVLKGHLNLAASVFKEGCSGVAIDYNARQPLWDLGLDYNHGTGHGVGYLLSVHEPPNAIRYRILPDNQFNPVFKEGMITSNEPGVYLEGEFGIRIENLVLCEKKEKNQWGTFLCFKPLTLVPYDRELISFEDMSDKEIELLDNYHKMVYEMISPYLTLEEKIWLRDTVKGGNSSK